MTDILGTILSLVVIGAGWLVGVWATSRAQGELDKRKSQIAQRESAVAEREIDVAANKRALEMLHEALQVAGIHYRTEQKGDILTIYFTLPPCPSCQQGGASRLQRKEVN